MTTCQATLPSGQQVIDLTGTAPAGAALALAGACAQLLGSSCSSSSSCTASPGSRRRRGNQRLPAFQQQQQEQQQAATFTLLSRTEQVLAGAVARTAAQALIYPLDTVKTRLQVSGHLNPQLSTWKQGLARTCDALARMDLGSLLMRSGRAGAALQDLFRGVGGALGATLPAATIFFAVDHACKELLTSRLQLDRRHPLVHVGSASLAALASCVVRVPGDVLRHRVQVYKHADVLTAARHTLRHGGLFCGFGATIMRDVPEMAIQFTVYEALSKALTGSPHNHPLLVGGAAGALSAFATTPLDTIKAQLQCGQGACDTWAAVRAVASRGPAGFFAGVAPRVVQASLQSAAFFTLLEAIRGHMQQQRRKEQQQQQQQQGAAQQEQHQEAQQQELWRYQPPHLALARAFPLPLLIDTKHPLGI